MEKNIDYNKKIREIGKLVYNNEIKYLNYVYGFNGQDNIISRNSFLNTIYETLETTKCLFQMFHDIPENIMTTYSIFTMMNYQLYIDYYKKLNLKESLGTISPIEIGYLEKLRNSNSIDEIVELSEEEQSQMPYEMLDAFLSFPETSVYEKILQIKALNENDVKKLTGVNPYFITEKNKY